MCWAHSRHWGWFGCDMLNGGEPNGYALIPEGEGGRLGVFLAWPDQDGGFHFLASRVLRRNILNGAAYERIWNGNENASGSEDYDICRSRVELAWNTP